MGRQELGDSPGHPFRGNQYQGGSGGDSESGHLSGNTLRYIDDQTRQLENGRTVADDGYRRGADAALADIQADGPGDHGSYDAAANYHGDQADQAGPNGPYHEGAADVYASAHVQEALQADFRSSLTGGPSGSGTRADIEQLASTGHIPDSLGGKYGGEDLAHLGEDGYAASEADAAHAAREVLAQDKTAPLEPEQRHGRAQNVTSYDSDDVESFSIDDDGTVTFGDSAGHPFHGNQYTGAKELASNHSLEDLRSAYDKIDVSDIFFNGDTPRDVQIGDKTVHTTPRAIGDAKIEKRGWNK